MRAAGRGGGRERERTCGPEGCRFSTPFCAGKTFSADTFLPMIWEVNMCRPVQRLESNDTMGGEVGFSFTKCRLRYGTKEVHHDGEEVTSLARGQKITVGGKVMKFP